MSSSGQQILANRLPFDRLATTIETTVSAAFTSTETVIETVVAPLVIGRRYGVMVQTHLITTTAGDNVDCFIREDSVSGTIMQRARVDLIVTDVPATITLYAEYTALATGNKTFVNTGDRVAGAGNITRSCSAQIPAYMFVFYIDG